MMWYFIVSAMCWGEPCIYRSNATMTSRQECQEILDLFLSIPRPSEPIQFAFCYFTPNANEEQANAE